MPNSIKIAEGSIANALRAGSVHIGLDGKGPTSSTGFYTGINPPSGGYTVYYNKSGGPSITTKANDAALIVEANGVSGETFTTIAEALAYYAGQSDKMVMFNPINGIVTDSLVAYFAPGTIPSYPRSGTTLYDLGSEGHNGTLENGGTFNSNGWLNLDGVDDEITLSGADDLIQQKTAITLCILFRMETLGSLKGLLGCLNYGCTQNLGLVASNAALQFYNDTTTCMQISTSIVETGKWIYAVGTYDGTTTKINGFKEGVLSTAQTDLKSGATNSFTSEFQVFGAKHTNFFTDGDVARASVYQKVLTDAEILQNYHQAAIVTDNLHLAFDAGNLMSFTPDDTSTTQDLVSSTTGTLTNGVAFSSGDGGGWDFDGVDDYINLGQSNNVGYNQTTTSWEVWIKSSDNGSSSDMWATFMGCRYGNSMQIGRYSNNNTLGILAATSADGTGSGSNINLANTDTVVFDEKWHYCVVTFDTGVFKVYVDGELVLTDSQRSGQLLTTSNDTFGIGGSPQSSRYFGGNIAIARIYNKTLTAGEIEQNYNANINRFN